MGRLNVADVWLFVSYETDTGLAYAKLAKARFLAAGYRSWVWHDDRTLAAYTHEEIADEIDRCTYFIYINTHDSHTSEGQKFERATAWALQKRPHVLVLNGTYISPVLASCNQLHTNAAGFERACDDLAHEISERRRFHIGEAAVVADGAAVPKGQVIREGDEREPA